MSMSALMSALRGAGRQHLTASTVTARQTVTGSHVLRIQDYTRVIRKTVPTGTVIDSTTFHVGGHDWKIKCYPNGFSKESDQYTSLFVENLGGGATARYDLSLLDGAGKPSFTRNSMLPRLFDSGSYWGWKELLKNDELEEGKHLVDDCLTVLCDLTIGDLLSLHAEEVVAAPTSDLHLRGGLPEAMWSKETADVTVHAGGQAFAVHRWVLEARSPVFKADLEKTTDAGELHVDGVDAETFQALLYFMYTDTLPPSDATMAERLLVAADRYGLKLACEEKLCTRVDMGSVAAMLELSEQHGCAMLKEACMKFLSCPDNLRSFMAVRPMGSCG